MANDSEDISVIKEPAELDTYSGQYQRPGERRPALVFLRGELLAVPIPLDRAQVTVGRALDADIRVNDSRASRLHARIITEPDESGVTRYRLKDLDSTNGTIINGKAIDQALLQDGDKFGIGDQLIRFEMLDEIDREFQQQIHRLLVHDDLTGLLTSKSFFSELRREAARAEAESMPFCVLMSDLDYFKEVNEVRHQDAEGHRLGLGARGFPAQLGKKRFAGEQAGEIVVDQQAVNLLLKLAVDLVEHFKADQLIADFKLVAIMQEGIVDGGAVENRAVGRIEIGQTITRLVLLLAWLSRNARVQARSARVAYPHVGFQRATQSYFPAIERDGHGQQFAAQEDQRRPAFALLPILAGEGIDFFVLYY